MKELEKEQEWKTVASIIYDDTTQIPSRATRICEYIKIVRRITAKEILNAIKKALNGTISLKYEIDRLSKEYGVEVEE